MENEIKYLEEDRRKLAQEFLAEESKRLEEEKRKRNEETVKHVLESDLKTLLAEMWESPQALALVLEIKKVQGLQKEGKS